MGADSELGRLGPVQGRWSKSLTRNFLASSSYVVFGFWSFVFFFFFGGVWLRRRDFGSCFLVEFEFDWEFKVLMRS